MTHTPIAYDDDDIDLDASLRAMEEAATEMQERARLTGFIRDEVEAERVKRAALDLKVGGLSIGEPRGKRWRESQVGGQGQGLGPDQGRAMARDVMGLDAEQLEVEWIWGGHIPRGMITMLDGHPALGKTTMMMDLLARLTRGDKMPNAPLRELPLPAMNVYYISGDDSIAHTLAPRAESAGADMERIWFFEDLLDPNSPGGERILTLPRDIEPIWERVAGLEAGIVVIDPIMSFLGGELKVGQDNAVQHALMPVRRMAEELHCSVVAVRHLRKDNRNPSAMLAGQQSTAFMGKARAGLIIGPHPVNEGERVVACSKNSLAAPGAATSMTFTIETHVVERTGVTSSRVVWGPIVDTSANDLVAAGPEGRYGEEGDKHGQAEAVLRELLDEAGVKGLEIKLAVEEVKLATGCGRSTVYDAAKKVGATWSRRFDDKRVWAIPPEKDPGGARPTTKSGSETDDSELPF